MRAQGTSAQVTCFAEAALKIAAGRRAGRQNIAVLSTSLDHRFGVTFRIPLAGKLLALLDFFWTSVDKVNPTLSGRPD